VKFTLNDYQADAVADLLAHLSTARKMFHDLKTETSVALTAPTGAGKTVMAAAAIESLFFGNEAFDSEPDPGAIIIWFSDNPNLHEQSRYRLMQASEKLTPNRLVNVKPPFAMRELEHGHVYFINTQRLSRTSLLTRGYVASGEETPEIFDASAPPDELAFNIWETIGNTISDADRRGTTIYFVLDEAHRGFDNRVSSERTTIVQRLVDGTETGTPMPIVIGISATIGRFKLAMGEASKRKDRVTLPEVVVDPSRVQASGLVKDVVNLDIPDEPGDFSTTLVAEGARKLRLATERWRAYCVSEELSDVVVPLLVLQIPNTPDHNQVGSALDAIQAVIPEIGRESVRHVLTEGRTETFGKWDVAWIQPQRVQEQTEVRVLVAKEAISTGWDCPRAEVLVSFRPAKDQTHIAQLLGRMVRSPLARRIPGDDVLNSVDCILPYFDKSTATSVVKYMTGQIDGLPPISGGRVLLDPRELKPNPNLPDKVWKTFGSIPSQLLPRKGAKPVPRLLAFGQALSMDGIRPGSLADIKTRMHGLLDGLRIIYQPKFAAAIQEILEVRVDTISGKVGGSAVAVTSRLIAADERAIRAAFEDSKRVLGRDIANSYLRHLVDAGDEDPRITIAALSSIREVWDRVDEEAARVFEDWFSESRLAIKSLSDIRRREYDEIRALAIEPQTVELRLPRNRLEDFSVIADGRVEIAPTANNHLMSDPSGKFPVGSLNTWEREVLEIESSRDNFVAWYRNPSHNGADSISVAYRASEGSWAAMHPDFLIFTEVKGEIMPSIVDPHGHFLEDSLAKLRGLAAFAEQYGDAFHRVDAVIHDSEWRVLDLKQWEVRAIVAEHQGPVSNLYRTTVASRYN
jgi:hypothetical protein